MKHIIFLLVFVTITGLQAQTLNRTLYSNASAPYKERRVSGAGTQTVNVLALRVQFRKEITDNLQTTGNGHFDLRDLRDSLTIDPPPHNKRYFEDQLLAMKNYYEDVSDGKLIVNFTVKPDGMDSAYSLNQYMNYYGIRGSQSVRDVRLAKFFMDAIIQADASDAIDFSSYDYIIVFHAGVGQDFSSEDNTPNDLSSRFISLDLLKKADTSAGFDGIPVNGGMKKITSGVVVPETESQFLIDPLFQVDVFREIGLSGILISNFGSQLGMPDLFNTQTGHPAVGVFGLEDQGAVNGDGLIPVEPDPWTKIYMGWCEPIILRDTPYVQLLPRKLAGKNTVIKIPINENEYYLVENRQRDVVDNSLFPVRLSRIDTIRTNGSYILDTIYLAGAEQSAVSRVITKIDEYDAALPGSGLLIWHIDENVIRANIRNNAINNDRNNRGIRVVEGSGSQDIGYLSTSGPFTAMNAGDRWDFFFRGNEGFKYYNNDADSVFFTATSVPNSMGKNRVHSGIRMTDISPLQNIMSFRLRTSLLMDGFPQFINGSPGFTGLTGGNISGDSKSELIAATTAGKIFAWHSDGSKVIPNNLAVSRPGLGKDSTEWPLAVFAQASDSIYFTPALSDLDNDHYLEIIAGANNGTVYVWKAVDANMDGFADTVWTRSAGSKITTAPVITNNKRIIIGTISGHVIIWDHAGNEIRRENFIHPVLSLALLNQDSVWVRTDNKIYILPVTGGISAVWSDAPAAEQSSLAVGDLLMNGTRLAVDLYQANGRSYLNASPSTGFGYPIQLPERSNRAPSLADIDQDGFLEIMVGLPNRIYAFNHNGTLVTNFPVALDAAQPAGTVTASLLIGDINDDGLQDILAASGDGRVFATDKTGNPVSGFPLSAGFTVTASPFLTDLDDDGDMNVAAVSEDGFVYVWDLPGAYRTDRMRWIKINGDIANTSLSVEQNTLSDPGEDLMPKKKAYCYPNPSRGEPVSIRYYLSKPADVKIKIFDMAGDLIKELDGTGFGQTDNEVKWNIQKIQSGVYFAKIEAKALSGKKVIRTVKIAVTK